MAGMRARRLALATVLAAATVAGGCGDDEPAEGTGEVVASDGNDALAAAMCDALRTYVNDLVDIVNERSRAVTASDDPTERRTVLLDAYDRLAERATRQVETLAGLALPAAPSSDRVRADLVDGARAGVAELEEERTAFATAVEAVDDEGVRGAVGQLFTSLEKVFSLSEPPIATYGDRAFQEAVLAEPDCRHVIQPFRLDE